MAKIRGTLMHTLIDTGIPLAFPSIQEEDVQVYGMKAFDASNPRAWIPLEILFQHEKHTETPRLFRQWFASLFESDLSDEQREAKHNRFLSRLLGGAYPWLSFLAHLIEHLDDQTLRAYTAFLGLQHHREVSSSGVMSPLHRAACEEDLIRATANLEDIFSRAMELEETDISAEDNAKDARVHIMRLVYFMFRRDTNTEYQPRFLFQVFQMLCGQGFFSTLIPNDTDTQRCSFTTKVLQILRPCLRMPDVASFHTIIYNKLCLTNNPVSAVSMAGEKPTEESTTLSCSSSTNRAGIPFESTG